MDTFWTDELVKEYATELLRPLHIQYTNHSHLEDFKKSKQVKKPLFNHDLINKRIAELELMEQGFNIAKEGRYENFYQYCLHELAKQKLNQ
jgi:hypothetical protein